MSRKRPNASPLPPPPPFDATALIEVNKLTNLFVMLSGTSDPLIQRLSAETHAQFREYADFTNTPLPPRDEWGTWSNERHFRAKRVWDSWWSNDTPSLRAEMFRLTKTVAPHESVVEVVGDGLLDPNVRLGLHERREMVRSGLTDIAAEQRRLDRSLVEPRTLPPPIIPRGAIPLSKKASLSQFDLTVSTQRTVNGITGPSQMKADALRAAFSRVLSECLRALKYTGKYMNCWVDIAKAGVKKLPAPFNKATVIECQTFFRIEVGPKNGYMHAHCYVGVRHRIKVQIDFQWFRADVLLKMNALRTTHPMYDFGEPLAGVYTAVKTIRAKSIELGIERFFAYVRKDDEENAAFYRRRLEHQNELEGRGIEPPGQPLLHSDDEGTNDLGERLEEDLVRTDPDLHMDAYLKQAVVSGRAKRKRTQSELLDILEGKNLKKHKK